MELSKLIEKADGLFKKYRRKKHITHTFGLYNHNGLWMFSVINDWHKWINNKREHQFGYYDKPEYAITAFLTYVKDNKINVKKLMTT